MGFLAKIVTIIKGKRRSTSNQAAESLPSQKQIRSVSSSLNENLTFVSELLGSHPDVVARKVELMSGDGLAGIVYLSGLADKEAIDKHILEPLITKSGELRDDDKLFRKNRLKLQELLNNCVLLAANFKETNRMEQVITAVLTGDTCLFLDGTATAMIISTRGFEKRGIEQPITETSVLGSKESFIEDLATNIAMLRRRLPTPDLRFDTFVLGRISRTEVRLAWIEGLSNPKIIEEARHRIGRIDVDFVSGNGMIAELIEDKPTSIWPQVHLTERPDVLAANLAEGRFAVFCDGIPFVIIAPTLFWQMIQTPDDYTLRPVYASGLRLLRQMALYASILFTPIYVAIVSYHPSVIPRLLAFRIAEWREGVPFPSIVETLLLSMIVDLLKEAGVRLPQASGGAVTFLGAVVIGQAAVSAGFVSPAVTIVVAVSAIANFAIPSQELAGATRLANYFLILWAAVFGMFGVTLGMTWLLLSLISLRSFGIPLFYPIAPGELYGLKDILVRAPIWQLRKRPSLLAPDNQLRMGDSTVEPKPKPRGDDNRGD